MSGHRRLDWLGLTPEPERELPAAVAALRASSHRPPGATAASPALAAAERRRVERLVLRGSRHGWLRYLAEVTELVTAVAAGREPGDRAAALLAGEVVLDHHRMLIGLPGTGYDRTAGDRTALESAVRALRTTARTGESR
uniref:TetR family transcriptional regulator n=1 Tax=Streptomyces sp. NBC_00049 TaxID=2903617 RepID=A0AAU2JI99_9ACTN